MSGKFWRISTFFLVLGFAQAAVAFCPIGSAKKAKRAPLMPVPAPVMAWVPAQQPLPRQVINGQAMVLVPVYPAAGGNPYPYAYRYPR